MAKINRASDRHSNDKKIVFFVHTPPFYTTPDIPMIIRGSISKLTEYRQLLCLKNMHIHLLISWSKARSFTTCIFKYFLQDQCLQCASYFFTALVSWSNNETTEPVTITKKSGAMEMLDVANPCYTHPDGLMSESADFDASSAGSRSTFICERQSKLKHY